MRYLRRCAGNGQQRARGLLGAGALALVVGCGGSAGDDVTTPVRSENGEPGAERPAAPAASDSDDAPARTCRGPAKEFDVVTQAELDALEGCETIDGSLRIIAAIDLDLEPLQRLRTVNGDFTIVGGTPEDSAPGTDHEPAIVSLEGLENLERVEGRLTLSSLKISTLAPLARLRFAAAPDTFSLSIVNCDNLESLEGLAPENAPPSWMELIGNEHLAALAPLHYRPQSTQSKVMLRRNPNLRDLSAFSEVSELEALILDDLPLENLDALASLRSVYQLELTDDAALVDAGMLADLDFIGMLEIAGCTSLTDLPDLPRLESLTSFFLMNNPELLRVPLFANLTGENELPPSSGLVLPPNIGIENNPKLERVDAFPSLRVAGSIVVRTNERLRTVAFDALQTLTLSVGLSTGNGDLLVVDNANLETLSLANLTSLRGSLWITDNPLLPSESLDVLRTLAQDAQIARNLGDP